MPVTHALNATAMRRPDAFELAVEQTRLLYQGSFIPTLLMLITGLACCWVLYGSGQILLAGSWLLWILILAALRTVQVSRFQAAMPVVQSKAYWRYSFLFGAGLSGISLAFSGMWVAQAQAPLLQAVVFGVMAAAILSACVSYAVSLPAFLVFTLSCLLPLGGYFLSSASAQLHAASMLLGILMCALALVAFQVNRLIRTNLIKRLENQELVLNLTLSKQQAEMLNRTLGQEVRQRANAEFNLRTAHDELEKNVAMRTQELADTTAALGKSQARLALALEASGLGLWDWDLVTDQVHHTQIKEIFGIEPDEVNLMLNDLRPRVHPEDLAYLQKAMLAHFADPTQGYVVEYRVRHGDGSWVWIEDRGQAVEYAADGRVTRMIGTRRDIGEKKRRETEQQLAATVFEAAGEGIMILDPNYVVLSINQALTDVTGYNKEDLLGRNIIALARDAEIRKRYWQIRRALEARGSWQGELVDRRKNGEFYPQFLQLQSVYNAQGGVSHIVVFFADLSVRREAEERLRYLSHYDELTGLANRTLFKERLEQAVQDCRQKGESIALLHIDLDRFKLLNDSLGHEVADQLLRQMSRRLSQALPEADTLGRLSGDEFVAILRSYGSSAMLARTGSRLLSKLRMPMDVGGHELVVSASVGISLMPENTKELATLVSQADMAMQHAKHLGGNSFQFYNDQLQACTLERLQLENQLRKGIDEGQLEVFYQPKLCLKSNRIESVEALVRWRHPQLGLVPPGEFIGLAEETGLIVPIGEFVLRQACLQAKRWHRQGLGQMRVAVNLSVQQLRSGSFSLLVREVLEQTQLAPEFLELELTESQLLDNVENIIVIFQQLKAMGVKLAIDDFGTGFSSLSYLKRFPVDVVKIDQTFVRDLSTGGEDAAITRAIIALVHNLSLKVVAEGVETQEQLAFLRAHGCDEVQGYLISRPVPAADVLALLTPKEVLEPC